MTKYKLENTSNMPITLILRSAGKVWKVVPRNKRELEFDGPDNLEFIKLPIYKDKVKLNKITKEQGGKKQKENTSESIPEVTSDAKDGELNLPNANTKDGEKS